MITDLNSIFSLFPPTTTLRKYLRITYATTVERIGQLYCDIVSFATVRDKLKTRTIVQNLVAVRMKLNRSRVLKRNVSYEVWLLLSFGSDHKADFRGSFPCEAAGRRKDMREYLKCRCKYGALFSFISSQWY